MPSQCSYCAENGFTESDCIAGDCWRGPGGEPDLESGCFDCKETAG